MIVVVLVSISYRLAYGVAVCVNKVVCCADIGCRVVFWLAELLVRTWCGKQSMFRKHINY